MRAFMMGSKRTKQAGQRGFSLIELMIAMLLLAIGILATMAMQFSALAAHTGARETTGANELARTVEQMIRAESRGWRQEQGGPATATSPYSDQPNFLGQMDASPGAWLRPAGFESPLTQRLNDTTGADDQAARYCVYVAGQQLPGEDGYMRVAIAVVYPAVNGQFPDVDAANPTGQCPDPGELPLDREDQQDLELQGLRATRLSTSVRAIDS